MTNRADRLRFGAGEIDLDAKEPKATGEIDRRPETGVHALTSTSFRHYIMPLVRPRRSSSWRNVADCSAAWVIRRASVGSSDTVMRDAKLAKAWLYRDLRTGTEGRP